MAKFLNTDLLNEWIPRLIRETEKELIIIVPYIKTSERIFTHLLEANKRGVETTLVYRENKLTQYEKEKFAALDNLNLLHHPNVHAKCYYNGKYLIIGSMNLYEYSELNNREMGVLLHRFHLEGELTNQFDSPKIFEDAVQDINLIIRASEMERQSRETVEEGFEMDIIKTPREKLEQRCKEINKLFLHKRFEPTEVGSTGHWNCTCKNYSDRIDVTLEHRACLSFQYDEKRVATIFNKVNPMKHQERFEGFRMYWSHHTASITLYKNQKHKMWQNLSSDDELRLMKNGIDQLIGFLRPFI